MIKDWFASLNHSETYFRFSRREKEIVIQCIREFLERNTWQFNTKDVSMHILQKLGKNFPLNKIREIMNDKFNLLYKRINSRVWNIDVERLQLTRILFSITVANMVDSKTLLINIDETLINKETKLNYSWTPVGKNSEWFNSKFAGSLNITFAICSNGGWIAMLSNETLTADRFMTFLKFFKTFLIENNNFEFKNVVLMLDNLSWHRTSKIIDLWQKYSFKIWYIPPYSPLFAPVELVFGILKRKLAQKYKGKRTSLSNYEGFTLVVMCLEEIKAEVIINCFSHFYRETRENLSKIPYLH